MSSQALGANGGSLVLVGLGRKSGVPLFNFRNCALIAPLSLDRLGLRS